MIRIITGATGTAHVTSADDGAINCGMMGDTSGVLKAGAKLEATIVDNNTIRLSDGDIMMQGRVGRVEPNTTEDLTISTGTVGTYRKDLIVVRYQMDNNTGYESMNLVVIEGTETSGTATDPAYNEGVIRTGASIVDMPLYRVNLDGINITGIDKLFIELDNIGSFKAAVDEVQEEVATLSDQLKSNDGLVFQLANDEDGNYGMLDKEGNFMAFGGGSNMTLLKMFKSGTSNTTPVTESTGDIELSKGRYFIFINHGGSPLNRQNYAHTVKKNDNILANKGLYDATLEFGLCTTYIYEFDANDGDILNITFSFLGGWNSSSACGIALVYKL